MLAAALTGALLALALPAPAPAASIVSTRAAADAVLAERVIGRSVQGRPLTAYHLGEPRRRDVETVVLLATMHGDEPAPRLLLRSLLDGPPIVGIDLWVLPVYNPDGLAAGRRTSARGVDLNRNFPYRWADLDGRYESGSRPGSEPETRAVMRFLRRVDPDFVLSFHQPLHGVDTDTKRPAFARRVASHLDLPRKVFDCGGVCHGTMTGWFNDRFDGAALTVEYGASPSRRHLVRVAPGQVLRVFGARFDRKDWQPQRRRVDV